MLSRRRFDVDEYHEMARAGVLQEDDRVELIDGEILQMTAIGVRHASCVQRLARALLPAVGDPGLMRVQSPVLLDLYSEPEPDFVLLRPRDDDYTTAHPGPADVLLLIEVADTSLPFDRGTKLALYAHAGIAEVWIVDLNSDRLEVYRDPAADEYARRETVESGSLSPLAFAELEVAVEEVLP